MDFLILPTQLFDKKYLDKNYTYILWEHPHYFTKYKYNKKKIMLHRGSMIYYFDYLKQNKFKVQYFTYKQSPKITNYCMFRSVDKIKLPGKYDVLDNPNFLISNESHEKYRKKTDKFFFNAFYMYHKKEPRHSATIVRTPSSFSAQAFSRGGKISGKVVATPAASLFLLQRMNSRRADRTK